MNPLLTLENVVLELMLALCVVWRRRALVFVVIMAPLSLEFCAISRIVNKALLQTKDLLRMPKILQNLMRKLKRPKVFMNKLLPGLPPRRHDAFDLVERHRILLSYPTYDLSLRKTLPHYRRQALCDGRCNSWLVLSSLRRQFYPPSRSAASSRRK